jgi:hypothetical protein
MRAQLDQMAEACGRTNDQPFGLNQPRRTQMAQRPSSSSVVGRASMLGQMSQMVAECPALEVRRDQDRRRAVAWLRLPTLSSHPCS